MKDAWTNVRRGHLARLGVVVQRHADSASVVTAVLADDVARTELPQTSVVVTRHGDQVSRVRREGTVPDPALVVGKGGLQEQSSVVRIHWRAIGLRGECLLRGLLARGVVADAQEISVLDRSVEDTEEVAVLGLRLGGWRRGLVLLVLLSAIGRLLVVEFLDRDLGWSVVGIKIPHLGGVVGRAGGQVLDIGRQEDAGEVVLVRLECADGDDTGGFLVLDHAPDVDIALSLRSC